MTNEFYTQLTPYHHLIYEDWEASIAAQGDNFRAIIQAEWGPSAQSILDVSCGIGTKSLGLAARGYQVRASDLSAEAVERARKEADLRDLDISFSVCDIRQAYRHHSGGFDVVICAGNSIPHLLSDGEIVAALQEMHACLRPDGGCLLTIRQYDQEERGTGLFKPFRVRDEGDRRYIIFQIWDFEGKQYAFSMYFVEEDVRRGADVRSSAVETHVMRSRYYAINPNHLLELMRQAGFEKVKRLDDGASHPAILVGTKGPPSHHAPSTGQTPSP